MSPPVISSTIIKIAPKIKFIENHNVDALLIIAPLKSKLKPTITIISEKINVLLPSSKPNPKFSVTRITYKSTNTRPIHWTILIFFNYTSLFWLFRIFLFILFIINQKKSTYANYAHNHQNQAQKLAYWIIPYI